MFSKIIKDDTIPPNFLNSILTNVSLYEMFKNDYDSNLEYFQGYAKEEYLISMLSFIENSLFSSNVMNIFKDPCDLEGETKGKLSYIRRFFDDFMLDEFKKDPEAILRTKFFRGMMFAKENDLYASKTKEFMDLFAYIFDEALDYDGIVEVLIKGPVNALTTDESLSLKEFDTLCNYVKNNIHGFVPMSIVTKMLKNHAFKTNHIFDAEVIECLVRSTAKSYLEPYGIRVRVDFKTELEKEEISALDVEDENIIILDEQLIDLFLSQNYTEIFTVLFYEIELLKARVLLTKNGINCETLKILMELVVTGCDLKKLSEDPNYRPKEFLSDLKASCFIKSLRFFANLGVNLFQNYINSELSKANITVDESISQIYSKKEISLEQRFDRILIGRDDKNLLIEKYAVLSCLYDRNGKKYDALELLKKHFNTERRDFIEDYLHSRIIDPEAMIDDVVVLANYKSKSADVKAFIERELKYIFTDTFYYSLDSFLKLKSGNKFDKEEYLLDLAFKVNCIKDTPLTHRFIDEALFTIEEMKQNTD